MSPQTGPYEHEYGDLRPDENPFRLKPFGKKIEDMDMYDYRDASLWAPEPKFIDDYHNRRHNTIKGMGNPYNIGAQKRHIERDISETLQDNEKGLIVPPHSFNMSYENIYRTQ